MTDVAEPSDYDLMGGPRPQDLAETTDFAEFFSGYRDCALWLSIPDGMLESGEFQAEEYREILSDEQTRELREDALDFFAANLSDLSEALAVLTYSLERAGHDFWLSRNGHGAGFFDRGNEPVFSRLQSAAKVYSDAYLDIAVYAVVESTPGYLPDSDDPAQFLDYSEAVAYADELADELETDGYSCDRSWASRDNYRAIRCERTDTVAPDLGRTIEVVRAEQC